MTDNGELNLLHIDERRIVLSKAVQPNTCKLMKPYSALLVTSYCTLHTKIASACLCSGSASAERAGQGEVAAVTPILAWIGLESATFTL